jgi:hypothetical protein
LGTGEKRVMNDLLAVLKQPLFWMFSALGSVVLAVAANLITPRVSLWIEKHSSTRRFRQRKRQVRLLGEVVLMYDDPQLLTQAKLDSIHAILVATFAVLLSVIAFVVGLSIAPYFGPLPQIVATIIGIALAWLGAWVVRVGMQKMRIARAYERRVRAAKALKREKEGEVGEKELFDFFREWDKREFGINLEDAFAFLKESYKPGQQDVGRESATPGKHATRAPQG